jgi:toxin CcdB
MASRLMARFDVHRLDRVSVLVVDIQADILRDLKTRLVIPLGRADEQSQERATRLRPVVNVAGVDYLLNTPEMAAVPCTVLGEVIDNINDQHHAITDAVDFLLQGF